MDLSLMTALVASGSALAGGVIAHLGAARLQSQRLRSEADLANSARMRQVCEQCLGHALEAQALMNDFLTSSSNVEVGDRKEEICSAPSSYARKAYALALLYLADVRPLARAFYESTAQLERSLRAAALSGEKDDDEDEAMIF